MSTLHLCCISLDRYLVKSFDPHHSINMTMTRTMNMTIDYNHSYDHNHNHNYNYDQNRYFAIVKPFDYHHYMNTRSALAMITAAWMFPTLISFFPILLGW